MTNLISELENFLFQGTRLWNRYAELFLAYVAQIQNQAISALKVIQNILVHKAKEQSTKLIMHF